MNLQQLDNVENELQFDTFTNEDSLNLGMTLIDYAKENNKAVAIHIERNRVPLFTHLMDGTSEENVFWLYRKKRIVDHYNRSSHYIRARFEEHGTTHDESSLLQSSDYQAVGGSFPIRIKGVGVIGSVTVAGLTPQLDHDYAVEGVKRFLKK
ncbi:heme-degrading domain-containing protein [Peribacillus frigoritolerans]|uniref:heme-degrading domain-containing protein n=1 Tax=Peribacillus frigoritolerans TaxID=450367 RepID=UPI0020BDCB16|nr:heme-degrading domain-containing protein [Peribacillus frigoritolerans]MEE3954477.1 heme-degrading domain-containing protein [Peribacillus frigoritolerans]